MDNMRKHIEMLVSISFWDWLQSVVYAYRTDHQE